MSAGNWFLTRKKAFDFSTLNRSTTAGVTYTVKVGSTANGFIYDRVIKLTHVDALGNVAITLPNGEYEGQRVLITYVAADTAGDSLVVTPATALVTATYTLTAVGDYCSLEWVNSTGGWVYLAEVTT